MSQGDDIQVVVFRVGGQEFAFHIFEVRRIARFETPAPLPQAPPFLEGVVPDEGGAIPVIDLRKRFSLPRAPLEEDTRIMVLECAGARVGAVVDHVVEVLRVAAACISPPPPVVRGLAAEYIQGIVSLPGRTIILLHTARVLTSAERLALDTLSAEPAHG
jgi:purine-binding chemotaxis protein CheW